MNLEKQKNDFYWLTLKNRVNEINISKAFSYFEEEGIQPVLIKGWSVARFYPEIWRRQALDIDLSVSPDSFEKAKILLTSSEGRKYRIDLHCGLRHLDTVSWENLFENTKLAELENKKIRILRAEDNLRVICTHWLNDGGEYKDRLWDIFYMVKNRPPDFDWDRCLQVVSPIRRRWIICCIGIAHLYLGLEIDDTPIARDARKIPVWVLRTLEKEWQRDLRLRPLRSSLKNKKQLWEQIKKRMPPNPIQATVEMEGDFYSNTPRIFYQTGNILQRMLHSFKKINQ